MTEIERIKNEKVKMEKAIGDAARAAVTAFKESTGLTPADITVQMVAIERIGCGVEEYLVGEVRAKVEI